MARVSTANPPAHRLPPLYRSAVTAFPPPPPPPRHTPTGAPVARAVLRAFHGPHPPSSMFIAAMAPTPSGHAPRPRLRPPMAQARPCRSTTTARDRHFSGGAFLWFFYEKSHGGEPIVCVGGGGGAGKEGASATCPKMVGSRTGMRFAESMKDPTLASARHSAVLWSARPFDCV